ncbi:carboxypeptidase-like regulatory domain-containing protein [Porphyromonadaceae sp. NP-X]|nr:carboxypeptidase-like regulatory domain-containing protein [Porphyromonadaceae sp. NP-X]
MKKLLLLNFLLFITLSVFSQNIQLQGVVVGQGNEPLPGVNVVVKGTTNGTITNNEGQFSINVPSTGILVISYVVIP